jgi:Uma2 family endonuclease
VIEVGSPSTQRLDRVRKLRLYARFGVREYWLVHPHPAVVEVLELSGDGYRIAGVYTDAETLHSPAFPDLVIELQAVFTLPVSAAERIDEIRESAPPYAAGSP